jgi:hypothetical protein
MRIVLVLGICLPIWAQTFEVPHQQIDFYGGGSYQVSVGGSAVMGTTFRQNFGQHVGVIGYYNYSPGQSSFGATPLAFEYKRSVNIQDYGGGIELHAPGRIQPYILGTFGGISYQNRFSSRNYMISISGTNTETHPAFGGGAGVRYQLNRMVAFFVESRFVRATASNSDYLVRGTAGVAITIPKTE